MSDQLKDLQRQIAKLNESMSRLAGEQEAIRFESFAQEYLKRKLLNPTLRRATKESFRNQVQKHLIPAFGGLELRQITNAVFLQWVTQKRASVPNYRFFNGRKSLIETLTAAVAEGHLERVPKFDNPDEKRDVGRAMEQREVLQILRHTRERFFRFYFFVLWKMGCRPREILQWEWAMITWNEPGHTWIDIPARISKTGRSRRIPINPQVSLRLYRMFQAGVNSRFVFPKTDDLNRFQYEYSGQWRRACRQAGIKAMPYDLRRTFITKCAAEGKPLIYVAKALDTSTKMIESVYAKAQVDVMEEIIK